MRTLNSTGCGWRILSKDVRTSSKAMIRIAAETKRPDRYSILPCPKGWWGSGFCPAIWNPTKVIREEPASDRLLKASAVMAMEPLSRPARNFPANNKMFSPIPTLPQRTP